MTRRGQAILSILALCILTAAIFLTIAWISPPAAQPAGAPSTDFSAGRAMQHLKLISREPHPMGANPAHTEVRDYLLGEIRELGLEPQVLKTFGVRSLSPNWMIAGAVELILTRIQGTSPRGAILMIAHYDTTPRGKGAGDNGSGVVTLLEIMSVLQAGPPLRQDVIALFTDGHEPGIIGTHAFVAQHPWYEDVRLVINMDTLREGPAFIYHTSQGNGHWIPALAKTATNPAYLSFPYELFPGGDSDIIPFFKPGIPGVSLQGATPGLEHHTTLDLPEAVNPRTVQQVGNHVLGMVRYLGDQPTLDSRIPEQTHFPLFGRLVRYPTGWAAPLTGFAILCFLGSLFYGFRKKKLTWKGVGLSFFTVLLFIALCVTLVNLLWLGIQALHPEYEYSSYRPHLSDDYLYFVGFLLLTFAIASSSIALVRRKVSSFDLAAGVLHIWLPLTIVVTILFPAASYLSTWVLLSGSLALLIALAVEKREKAWIFSSLGFLISAILASFLWIPMICIAFFSGPMASGFLTLSIAIAAAAIWMVSLMPMLDWVSGPKHPAFLTAVLVAALGVLITGHFLVGKNSPLPMQNSIGYWLDADASEASWIAFIGGFRTDAHRTDEHQAAFPEEMDERQIGLLADPVRRPYTDLFQKAPPFSVLTCEAPILTLDGPRMEVLADDWIENHRMVGIHFTSSMNDRLYIIIPQSSNLLAVTIPRNEKRELSPVVDDEWVLRLDGMPVDGIEIHFEFSERGPIQILLVEEKTGLPDFPGLVTQPVPGRMQYPGEFYQGVPTDFTAIHRNFVLQGISR